MCSDPRSPPSFSMRSQLEDLSLVARCKRELPRKHEAFEELVRAYQDRIYTVCYRMLDNEADAQDVLQEVLLRLYLSIGSFDGRSSFSTWLYRVVYNHCLNALQKRKRISGRSEELVEEPADPRTMSTRTRRGRAEAALAQLSAGDRSVLLMKYVAEMEVQQMTDILGQSNSAVKMRLLRAREQFKRRYKESV